MRLHPVVLCRLQSCRKKNTPNVVRLEEMREWTHSCYSRNHGKARKLRERRQKALAQRGIERCIVAEYNVNSTQAVDSRRALEVCLQHHIAAGMRARGCIRVQQFAPCLDCFDKRSDAAQAFDDLVG